MVDAFPDAELLCLWSDVENRYPGRRLEETWVARTPLRRSKIAALPVMPTTWRRRPGAYDWALVSSHLFAHHVTFRDQSSGFRKYVYVHSPARYIWEPSVDGRGSSVVSRAVAPALRALDRNRAAEITDLAANSEYVRSRVQRTWGLDATVVYPPVDIDRISAVDDWAEGLTGAEARIIESLPPVFLLGASRLVAYKRLDLALRAGDCVDVPVVIAGSGPDLAKLQSLARDISVPVTFIAEPSDALLFALYQRCLVYVFPAVEDFGIMPVEAMAAGAPVACGMIGGVTESVVDGVTGAHIDFDDMRAVRSGVEAAASMRGSGPNDLATRFGTAVFRRRIREFVDVESWSE
ncbi:glycosyltransferase [Cellulomonas sp. Root485]|uniref:glycosyltransferase n=1 Tax=Cellulomonas sp. Root485 TaxID=1736546 RepID=UPI0009E75956|nr:glycosyltransferase [Cellulomonas sp. Root485]